MLSQKTLFGLKRLSNTNLPSIFSLSHKYLQYNNYRGYSSNSNSNDLITLKKKSLLKSLNHCKSTSEVWHVLNSMSTDKIHETMAYNIALRLYVTNRIENYSLNDINDIYNNMTEKNISRDIVTYNTIFKLFANDLNYQEAFKYFHLMIHNDNIRPNIYTFKRLLKCLSYSAQHLIHISYSEDIENVNNELKKIEELAINLFDEYQSRFDFSIFLNFIDLFHQCKNLKKFKEAIDLLLPKLKPNIERPPFAFPDESDDNNPYTFYMQYPANNKKRVSKNIMITIHEEDDTGKQNSAIPLDIAFEELISTLCKTHCTFEYIEKVFEFMMDDNVDVIPTNPTLLLMLDDLIYRKDGPRILIYFKIFLDLVFNSKHIKNNVNDVNEIDNMINNTVDKCLHCLIIDCKNTLTAYNFVELCVQYNINAHNVSLLHSYCQLINDTFKQFNASWLQDIMQYIQKQDQRQLQITNKLKTIRTKMRKRRSKKNKIVKILKDEDEPIVDLNNVSNIGPMLYLIAKDIPAQIEKIKTSMHIFGDNVVSNIYSPILNSILQVNEESVGHDNNYVNHKTDIAYTILDHWYCSYYITHYLWNEYVISQDNAHPIIFIPYLLTDSLNADNRVSVLNASDWHHQSKLFFIFYMLEEIGLQLIENHQSFLYVQLTNNENKNKNKKLNENANENENANVNKNENEDEDEEIMVNTIVHDFKECYENTVNVEVIKAPSNVAKNDNENIQNIFLKIDLNSWEKYVLNENVETSEDKYAHLIDKTQHPYLKE